MHALMNIESNRVIACTPVYPSCPSDYVCTKDDTDDKMHFCCPGSMFQLSIFSHIIALQCPNGRLPYIDPIANITKRCQPDRHYGCPDDYSCQQSANDVNSYICCQQAGNRDVLYKYIIV
jgi:hypothetical protein